MVIIDAPLVRALTHRDASLVRKLYLKMFADSRDAFGETLESVRGLTLESWTRREIFREMSIWR